MHMVLVWLAVSFGAGFILAAIWQLLDDKYSDKTLIL
jgi:hypothetical protein